MESESARKASTSDAAEWNAVLRAQRAHFAAEEKDLEGLLVQVRNVRELAGAVGREADEQTALIDGLEHSIDHAQNVAGRRNSEARDWKKRQAPLGVRRFCMLLWPAVLLVLFILWLIGLFGRRR
mmetsp:Transcript_11883/g.31976  ORF Transcript_11883/g.31976 Transcript_11883/m.31976 type:complete len:125 (-) Transcript_11883:399-773(-)